LGPDRGLLLGSEIGEEARAMLVIGLTQSKT
jgi:hypothetical protein